MSTIHGKLTPDRFAQVGPVHAPAFVPRTNVHFAEVDLLTFRYVTDAEAVAEILPSVLELDDQAIASITVVSYGISGVGSYLEFVQQIGCRFQGRPVQYTLHIYVDNEPAMLAGREWLGWPKQLGRIAFDAKKRTQDGLIETSLHRPTDLPLATGLFRPGVCQGDIPPGATGVPNFNLRMIPSAIPEKPPVISELICTTMTVTSGRVWAGEGSLHLTGASEFAPLHRAPVIKLLDASLVHNATVTLTCPTETFPL